LELKESVQGLVETCWRIAKSRAPDVWTHTPFGEIFHPNPTPYSTTTPISKQLSIDFLKDVVDLVNEDFGDHYLILHSIGMKNLLQFPTCEDLHLFLEGEILEMDVQYPKSTLIFDYSCEVTPSKRAMEPPQPIYPSPETPIKMRLRGNKKMREEERSLQTRSGKRYQRTNSKANDEEENDDDDIDEMIPMADREDFHIRKGLLGFVNSIKVQHWVRKVLRNLEIEDVVNPLQRFKVGSKLTSYPCFGLVDLSNLQSPHPILKMDEEGSCTPKSLYPSTPSIMALKIYSTSKNPFLRNKESPFCDVHIAVNNLMKCWGLTDELPSVERGKWEKELERVFDLIDHIPLFPSGVRMEITGTALDCNIILEILLSFVNTCRTKTTKRDSMILSFGPNTIKNHLIERVKSTSSLIKACLISDSMTMKLLPYLDYVLKSLLWHGDCSKLPRKVHKIWMATNILPLLQMNQQCEISPFEDNLGYIQTYLFSKAPHSMNYQDAKLYLQQCQLMEMVKIEYENGDPTIERLRVARFFQLFLVLQSYYASLGNNLSQNRPILPFDCWPTDILSYGYQTFQPVIQESNNLLQQSKLDGEKILGWRERQLKIIFIGEASKGDVLKLYNPASKYWSRYGFWILFNRLSSSPDFNPLASLGSYQQYMHDLLFILRKGNLVFHACSTNKFSFNSSHMLTFGDGRVPASWIRLFNQDFANFDEFELLYPLLEYEEQPDDDGDVKEPEEEEEEDIIQYEKWTRKDSALLLFLRDLKEQGWMMILGKFQNKRVNLESLKKKYRRLKYDQKSYQRDRTSKRGRQFASINSYYFALKKEAEDKWWGSDEESQDSDDESEVVITKKKRRRK